ncbi:cysteine desulfurase NifS [Virgibacillus profundi]|uniref:Cysteine desulfurase NifS n=1 Tax=Virgibacillus profundi TaxID=2024555 RepID=A0A2A2IDQ9_9BACI|nr:cysteine desulfurase family protein [Virgibacillus profundi]PAV30141.1 cysteine desulfurase NifS [Virgibacillus profundi]PXY54313.1 cysteine desulfurase [Virgibacillus profundi]
MIYLDNSATTKPNPAVLKSFEQVTERFFANPSSIHQFGGEAERLLMKARNQAAEMLGVGQNEIIFTSGGTEGNNIAIKGIALEHQNRGKHIITTEIEHPSVYDACSSLKALGFEITYLPVDHNGVISLTDLKNSIRKDTILISIMHVNNETGSIQPIEEIGKIAKEHPKLFFHVDDVQGLGKVPLQLPESGIDLCTFSGHKIHGLKGTGILYVNNRTTLFPLFHGGNQENAIRSGTENLAGAVAMVKALRLIKEREKEELNNLYELQKYLLDEINRLEGVVMNTPLHSAPHIINISVPGIKPEVIIHMLGEKDIYISTKSACSSKQKDESKVLTACGFNKERSISALRISLSYDTSKSEIRQFIHALKIAVNQFKEVME